ncbi:9030_t:CDS:2 [Funneliformis caledonium]|uniref:9030_t:CDS:1 n=1 Tax=Funneliformis caledonium TaxID=1117310 RepID=A0A9N8ZKQ2_9GLOM|nr:9030_t:CDS:2 [Funneliformis caledonium]
MTFSELIDKLKGELKLLVSSVKDARWIEDYNEKTREVTYVGIREVLLKSLNNSSNELGSKFFDQALNLCKVRNIPFYGMTKLPHNGNYAMVNSNNSQPRRERHPLAYHISRILDDVTGLDITLPTEGVNSKKDTNKGKNPEKNDDEVEASTLVKFLDFCDRAFSKGNYIRYAAEKRFLSEYIKKTFEDADKVPVELSEPTEIHPKAVYFSSQLEYKGLPKSRNSKPFFMDSGLTDLEVPNI